MRNAYYFIHFLKTFYPPVLTSALIGFQTPLIIYEKRWDNLPFLLICPVFYSGYQLGNMFLDERKSLYEFFR